MNLPQIRTAITEALAACMLKNQRECAYYAPIPRSLEAATIWLAAQGFEDAPTEAELYYGWALDTARSYLGGLGEKARAEEIEAGRRVIFEGRGSRAPLVADVALKVAA